MKFISYNYAQLAPTVITASSSNSNFPVKNIKHQFRSKEWRSKGYFNITPFNNSFDTSNGAHAVGVGTYNAADLAEMMSIASGLTVSYAENTGLWSFSSDTNFSLFNDTGLNAGNLLSVIGFNELDLTGSNAYTAPKPSIHTEEFITFDLKTTESIDSVVLLWGKGNFKLSSDAIIKVQGNATANFNSPAVDETMTFNNTYEIASFYFETVQNYRYWRITIIDPANPNGYVNLGTVILGSKDQIDDPGNGFTFSQTDNSKITQTDFGQEYVDEYPISNSVAVDFKVMDYAMAETLMAVFARNGSKLPVFIVIDPSSVVFDKDCFAIYGKLQASLSQTHVSFNLFDSGLTIREIN